MNPNIIENTVKFVKETLKNASGCHDWFHVYRVWKNAKNIAKTESVDLLIVELGALLHDIADSKFHNGDETIGPKVAKNFLISQNVDEKVINHVILVIENISFKGGNYTQKFHSFELDIIQDADRLDAMGAIGIARAFTFGGYKGNEMYNPDKAYNPHMTVEEDKKKNGATIHHFYEKLLLLKDKMNTSSAKKIAEERHKFMELYLEQFYNEWEGNN